MTEKLLLRPQEAAELTSIGRSKMYELISSGEVPSVKIGRSVRVPAQALRDWIIKQQEEQKTEVAVAR